ncbi:MAG TPA: DUF1592 domain-containing protein [Gammaproteobacteria bacterium]|nr:DUF1592 domain-containing protein [Gammaproteobacteria bacterium]
MGASIRSRIPILALTVACATVAAVAWLAIERGGDAGAPATGALVDRYCVDCHNGIDLAGSLRLDDKDPGDVGRHAETWERVVRKLRTGMMPPAGEPRPPRASIDELAVALESRLDDAHAANPVPGPSRLRRLNRTEYGNAIRDLLALDVDAAMLLPLDDSSEGFDNIATALVVSPSLVEAYVSAAMKISRRAIGDRTAPRTQFIHPVAQDLEQDRHLEGLPLGTRGGTRFEHLFPLDAEYEFRLGRGLARGGRVDVTIDGVPVDAGDGSSFRIPVTAGPHTLTVALVDTRRAAGVADVYAAPPSTAGIRSVEIDGPFDPAGVGDTPSRRRILTCEPAAPAEETDCAAETLSNLATRAFRRPLTAAELPPLVEFFEAGRAAGGFEVGIQQALARILVDPRFIYRLERDPADVPDGEIHAIDDYELATRLSFFLWSSIPDDALLAVAATDRLDEPVTLEREVARMLADEKSSALVENFAAQWLFLRELESVTPDAERFTENLRDAMARESKLLFETVLREDLSALRLLDADFTFVDERLAEHYGLADVRGSHFRRIEIPEDNPRRGVLGHASILTVTSVTNRTSPVIRGAWILETLLGSPAPVPPPDVETTLEGDDGDAVALSVRERLEAHRENPVCASCHTIMDPIGFTLENYDLIGAWRETDGGRPIDTRAVLVDGSALDGPGALREALLVRSEAFVTTLTEKLMTYALGRRVEHYDMPAIRAIVREAAADDYRLSSLVQGVVASDAFRTRLKGGTD